MCVLCPVLVVCLYICAWQPCWISSQNVIAMNIAMNPRRTMLPVVMLMISSPWRKSRGLAALTLTVNLHSFGVTFYILYISITNIFYIFTYLSHRMPALLIEASWTKARVVARSRPETQLGLSHPETDIFLTNLDFRAWFSDQEVEEKSNLNSRSFACDKVLCTSFFWLKNAAWSSS